MKKFTFFLIYASLVTSFFLIGEMKTNPAWAQDRSSEEFFNQGTQEMNEEIQDLEERQNEQQTLEQKEEKLEQELNIRQEGPRVEEVPGADEALGLDDNLPFQPDAQEVEVRF